MKAAIERNGKVSVVPNPNLMQYKQVANLLTLKVKFTEDKNGEIVQRTDRFSLSSSGTQKYEKRHEDLRGDEDVESKSGRTLSIEVSIHFPDCFFSDEDGD